MATPEANPSQFPASILSKTPKDLLPELDQLGFVSLVKEGYRLVGTDKQILEWTEDEFSQKLHNPTVLYSMHPDRPDQVGAFLIVGRPTYIGRQGLEIGGIIVANDHPRRGKGGEAERLMKLAVKMEEFHFIIGVTLNIRAMLLRNRVTAPFGFGTMASSIRFSSVWSKEMLAEAETIEELYRLDHQGKRHGKVIVEVDPEFLEPIQDSMRGDFPHPYNLIQDQLFHHQKLLGASGTACVILLSIKEPMRLQM